MTLTVQDAESVLSPYYHVFREIGPSFQRFYAVHAAELGVIQPRTKSSEINDRIVDALKTGLPEGGGRHWESKHGSSRVWIDDQICLRVKKLDRNYLPCSQATLEFYNNQAPQLPGLSTGTFAFLGYRTNQLRTTVIGIYVVCLQGKDLLWVLPVPGTPVPAIGTANSPVDSGPIPSARADAVDHRARVTLKQDPQQ